MKKRFAILSLLVLLLLVISQTAWIYQMAERDKNRFREELHSTLNDIVKYQATKQTYELFEMDPESPSITLEKINTDSIPANAKSYGNFETENYTQNSSLSIYLEAVMIEMLLAKDSLNLLVIDSIFQTNFPYISELLAYSLKIEKDNEPTDSLYFGKNALHQLNDPSKGVFIIIPLGTSGKHQFVSHFIFKPTVVTRRQITLVCLSAVAVIAVACILFILLFQLQRQMVRMQLQEKRVRGIVHDLKSPLSYIYTMLGFFEKEEENIFLSEGKTRVKELSDNIERMLSEIKFKENKKSALQIAPFDIEKYCRKISDELQLIYNDKHITTTFTIQPNASTIYVDPFYFYSCLHNLLDNAIKYSDNNPIIIIKGRKENNKFVISIADKGQGIPKKEQRKIFRDFYRSTSQSSVKGHGIGLSSVKQIVKAHNGKMKLYSEVSKGTLVIISIPCKQ